MQRAGIISIAYPRLAACEPYSADFAYSYLHACRDSLCGHLAWSLVLVLPYLLHTTMFLLLVVIFYT